MSAHPEILGLQEIATTLDVAPRTPHAWKFRRILPPADYEEVNGLEAWDWETVCAWAASSGRLPVRFHEDARSRGFVVVASTSAPSAEKTDAFAVNYPKVGLEVRSPAEAETADLAVSA